MKSTQLVRDAKKQFGFNILTKTGNGVYQHTIGDIIPGSPADKNKDVSFLLMASIPCFNINCILLLHFEPDLRKCSTS